MSSSNIDNSGNRQILIFEWLKTSKYICPLKENKGFHIYGGQIVRLKSGERIDLLDWLKREGFHTLKRIYNHSISYTRPNEKYQEKITFFNSEFRNDKYYEENKKREEFEESCTPDPYYDGGSIVDNWLKCHEPMEYDYVNDDEDSLWEQRGFSISKASCDVSYNRAALDTE